MVFKGIIALFEVMKLLASNFKGKKAWLKIGQNSPLK
jgi:hypothetical protein